MTPTHLAARNSLSLTASDAAVNRSQSAGDTDKQTEHHQGEQDAREQAVRRAPLAEQSSIVGTRWLGGLPAVGSLAKDFSGRAVCVAA